MNLIDRYRTFSKGCYSTILFLAIPYYLLLYGASGHRFDPPTEDIIWMIIVVISFVAMMMYLIATRKKGRFLNVTKVALAITLVLMAFGAIKFLLSMVDFKFGSDIGLVTRGLF